MQTRKPNARLVFSDAMPGAADCQVQPAHPRPPLPASLSLQSRIALIITDRCSYSKSTVKFPVLVEAQTILGSPSLLAGGSEPTVDFVSDLSSRLLRRCASRNDNRLRRHCEPTGRRCAPPEDGLREAISVVEWRKSLFATHYELYSSVSSSDSSYSSVSS
jgi:hypothetical protein